MNSIIDLQNLTTEVAKACDSKDWRNNLICCPGSVTLAIKEFHSNFQVPYRTGFFPQSLGIFGKLHLSNTLR